MNTKVWVVSIEYDHEDSQVVAVYSSKESAGRHAAEVWPDDGKSTAWPGVYVVAEWEVVP